MSSLQIKGNSKAPTPYASVQHTDIIAQPKVQRETVPALVPGALS